MDGNSVKPRILSLLSRKLIVFAVGTVALFLGKIPPEIWIILAGAYMGANVAQKFVSKK